jgi:DHA1 family multidrug resistance protein-like MFS transporter
MQNLPILYAVLFGAYIGVSLPLPLLGPLILSAESPFALSSEKFFVLSIVLAAFPLGSLFGAPLFGYFSDRFGKKRVLIMGLFIGGVCYALCGVAIACGNILLLIVARLVGGFGEGNATIAQSYIAQSADQHQRARLFGVMIAVMSVGYVAGPLLGAVATDVAIIPFASMALPFYVVAIFIGATLVLVAIFFKRDHASMTHAMGFVDGIKELYHYASFRYLIILAVFMAMGRSFYIDFLASFLTMRFSLAHDAGTLLWVLLAVVWGIAALFTDSGSRYASHQTKLIMATSLGSFSVLLIALIPNYMSLVIVSVFMVIGCALAGSLNAVLVSSAAPHSQLGLAMGILGSTYLLGEVTACFLGGILLKIDEAAPFVTSSILLFVATVGFYTLFNGSTAKKEITSHS